MKTVIAIFITALLTACGGGGDDDGPPDKDIGRPDCKADPSSCK